MRNFLAALLRSQGVTMLLHGDEVGRTQHGNDNAYCQDNEISWLDWDHLDDALLKFTRRLDGVEMSDEDWGSGTGSVGVFLNGEAITDRDPRGQRVTDDSLLLLFNGHHEPINWTLP